MTKSVAANRIWINNPKLSPIYVNFEGTWRYDAEELRQMQDEIKKAEAIKQEVIAEIEEAKKEEGELTSSIGRRPSSPAR